MIDAPFSLAGRNAIITGAAQGIGFATAARMFQAGANVVVNDIDGDALAEAVNELRQAGDLAGPGDGGRIVAVVGDVGDRAVQRALVDQTVAELGSVDILVNNAGSFEPTPLDDLDPDLVDRLFAVNTKGLLYLSAEAAKVMRPGSCIINISSLGGVRPPFDGLAVYHATKGAVDSLTRDMALEWGPRGIRVNGAAPGGILTEGKGQVTDSPVFSPERIAAITARAEARPLGRMGCADDLAMVIVFLASPAAGFITGQQLIVDGGYYLA